MVYPFSNFVIFAYGCSFSRTLRSLRRVKNRFVLNHNKAECHEQTNQSILNTDY